MLRLLKIEFYKLRYSKTFWVIGILYALLIIAAPLSVAGFLRWVKIEGGELNGFDPMTIPLLHFPDIWQNLTFAYGFLRIFMGILVIISVSNECTYRTIRQNVIDGLSRVDFIKSKVMAFMAITLFAGILVFFTSLFAGIANTPEYEAGDILYGLQFIGAFMLELFTYMVLALLLTVAIQRTGLTIVILLLFSLFEYIIGWNLPEGLDAITPYLPMHAMENLVPMPFQRYAFREIQDYVSIVTILVVTGYLCLFAYLTQLKLKKSDL